MIKSITLDEKQMNQYIEKIRFQFEEQMKQIQKNHNFSDVQVKDALQPQNENHKFYKPFLKQVKTYQKTQIVKILQHVLDNKFAKVMSFEQFESQYAEYLQQSEKNSIKSNLEQNSYVWWEDMYLPIQILDLTYEISGKKEEMKNYLQKFTLMKKKIEQKLQSAPSSLVNLLIQDDDLNFDSESVNVESLVLKSEIFSSGLDQSIGEEGQVNIYHNINSLSSIKYIDE